MPTTSATDQGTDWRDRDAEVEPGVEIYEGFRQSYENGTGPRAAKPDDAIPNLRPLGYVSEALSKGYRLGFMASSDRISTHMAYANVLVTEPTREEILDAIRKRHVYASTDNIVADVRSGDHLMGDEFTVTEAPKISVKLMGTAAFTKVVVVKDGKEAYSVAPNAKEVSVCLDGCGCRGGWGRLLLLCARRAERWAGSLGEPDVDHAEVNQGLSEQEAF